MAKKKADSNKALLGAPGTKLDLRTHSTDQDVLERNANFDGPSFGGDHKTTVCYNRGCPDYGVARVGDGPCSCRRTSVDRR
jgi:hypothetical protein